MTHADDVIEKVTKFSYLKDVLSSGGGVQEAITARRRCGWKKFKDIAGVLHKSCVRNVLCYGAKCYALKKMKECS